MTDRLGEQATRVGALAEPVRRALYRYVVGRSEAVSREQAATGVNLPVHTAKFHLDRLTDAGLLQVEFRRLTGRSGPGAGRPAKLYRRSGEQVAVSLPERHYDLAGEVLAGAVDRASRSGLPVAEAVSAVAREAGARLAAEPDESPVPHVDVRPDTAAGELEAVGRVLARHGYEPRPLAEGLCLANCPFDRLAAGHTELVCGLNRDLVAGVLEGLRADRLRAVLAPQPGHCCVRVTG
ncbi:MAG: helix-turn-helix domain-containing protein [Nocardioidaceae bacterium]